MSVFVIATPEPDAEIVEVWDDLDAAESRCATMHKRYPGMGYHVEAHALRSSRSDVADSEPTPSAWPHSTPEPVRRLTSHQTTPGRVTMTFTTLSKD